MRWGNRKWLVVSEICQFRQSPECWRQFKKLHNYMNDGQADLKAQLKQVVIMLNKMERTYASERSKAITELQNKIWDEFDLQNEELYFLQDFAGDLNFYEPIEKDRDATLGYYDDHRLLELTATVSKKIEAFLAAR
jgi:hypothetical protein